MVKKPDMDNSGPSSPLNDLSAQAEALAKAAKSLHDSSSQMFTQQQSADLAVPADADEGDNISDSQTRPERENVNPNAPSQPGKGLDAAAQHYYTQLEQTGQLADVDEQTDLSKLSPRITHIRHADGSIERIGFS